MMASSSWIRMLLPFVCCILADCSVVDAQMIDRQWARKLFAVKKIDFGDLARGSEAIYRVKIKNIYKQTVSIETIQTTCGCSAGRPTKKILQSGEVGQIEVTMDTRRFIRRKDSNLIVIFNAPLRAEVTIPITAYIRTDIVLDPGSVNFGPVDRGTGANRKVSIAYAGRNDWTLRGVESKHKHISARVVEKSRGGGRVDYELEVTLDKDAPAGIIRDQLMLLTDDVNSPRVPVLVEARVEADITISPSILPFGRLMSGQSKTHRLVLRGNAPFLVKNIECKTDDSGAYQVKLPKTARVVHILLLTFRAPDELGKFEEEFTVTIVGRDETLTFKTFGEVLSSRE